MSMAIDRIERTVLITGAGRRIGCAIAQHMARGGWRVAVHYRRSAREAEELAPAIESAGGRAVAIRADLAIAAEVDELVPRVASALGAPCCLVNNASEFLPDSATSVSEETWTTHQDVNLKVPLFLSKALYAGLPAGADGNIINIIDQRVWKLTPDFFSYTVSKAGLWTATRMLAQAMAPRVRVNAIGPGPVLKSVHQTEAEFEAEVRSTLLRRGPTPEEVAAAVGFILAAPAMTGQMIALDGGQHLAWADMDQTAAAEPRPQKR